MKPISDSILAAALSQSVKAEVVAPDDGEQIRSQAAGKFAQNHTYWLWEHLDRQNTATLQDPDAWRWVSEYIQENAAFMFFNSEDENAVFRFQNGFDIVRILGETSNFEFYLTNQDADYLICYNHHDFLCASGTAKEWLLKRIST